MQTSPRRNDAPQAAHVIAPRRLAVRVGLLIAVALVAAGAWVAHDRLVVQPRLADAALLGFGVDRTNVPAPPIELGVLGGGRFSLSAHRGQVVFVNFWATWCPPCREEMPSMVKLGRELAAKYPGRFQMLAVSVDEGWSPIQEYFAAPPFLGDPGLTVALDADQRATQAYYCAVRGGVCPDLRFPETYIVDRDGRLVAYMVGPRDWSDPTARAYLESLLGT